MITVNEMRNKLGKIHGQMKELGEKVASEGGTWSKEDSEKFDKMNEEFTALEKSIENQELIEQRSKLEFETAKSVEKDLKAGDLSKDEKDKKFMKLFHKKVAFGENSLKADEKEFLAGYESVNINDPEHRALTTQTDATGGYLIPEGFADKIMVARKAFGGMRTACEMAGSIMNTATGNPLPFPTSNDGDGPINPHTGAWLGENTQGTEKDIPFGVHTFNAWTVYSRIVRVPVQLLQDAFSAGGFNLEKFLAERLGTRIGRTENLAYTTGDGSSKPEGIISSSGTTHIRSAAGDDTLALNDFVDLETHVDSAYRTGAIYMFNDTSLGIIKKVALAASNAFLWQPSFRDGAPSLINGYKYVINNDMASPASGAKSVLFGDFSQYVIRDALGVTLLTLKERYADYLQVGFIAYARTDGAYLAAGSRDIAVLRNITT